MSNFCDGNKNPANMTDPVCGCYPDYANHSNKEKAVVNAIVKSGIGLSGSDPICAYSACTGGNAYKSSSMNNVKCPNICIGLTTIEAGKWSSVVVENVKYDIKCGEGGKIYTEKASEPVKPINPVNPVNPDDKGTGLTKGQKIALAIGIPIALFFSIGGGILAYKVLYSSPVSVKKHR